MFVIKDYEFIIKHESCFPHCSPGNTSYLKLYFMKIFLAIETEIKICLMLLLIHVSKSNVSGLLSELC